MKVKNESAPMTKISIEGTPFEVGVQVFSKVVIPCLGAISKESPADIHKFYCGLLSAVMGSMVADFGHETTSYILRALLDSFADFGNELPGQSKH